MNIRRLVILTGTTLLGLTLASVWLLFISGPPESARAASYTVCLAGPPTCDFDNIQAAIDSAVDGDTLELAGEAFTESITVNKSLTISGAGAENTIVQAANAPGIATSRVVTITEDVTVTIQELTVRHGVADGISYTGADGAGILNNMGTLILSNSDVYSNTAMDDGGGISNNMGTLILSNSGVYSNTAMDDGGGIFSRIGTITVTNSTIVDNYSDGFGGGIYNDSGTGGVCNDYGTATIINTLFSSNEGNGIFSVSSNLSVISSTFHKNNGSQGGGINAQLGCTLTIRDSTFTENSADSGGAIFSYVTLEVINSVFYSNTVTGSGGGIYINEGVATVNNSTFSGNQASLFGGIDS